MVIAILKIVEMRLLKYLTKGEKNPSQKQCDDGRQLMAIAHMTLWVRRAKNQVNGNANIN
jgi:hypothetical protein